MFADVIKNLEIVLDYWAIPKSNAECPERHIRRDTDRIEGLVKKEAENGVLQPQTKEHLEPPGAGAGKE